MTTQGTDRTSQKPLHWWVWQRVWQWTWYAVLLLAACLVTTAIVPLLPVNWWWVRIGDFPRLQLLASYILVLFTLPAFHDRRWVRLTATLLLVSCGIQMYWIFPYFPFAAEQVQDSKTDNELQQLKILSANVLQENENSKPLIELVRSTAPDILVLCEVNDRWMRDLKALDKLFPYRIKHPQENRYGIALYSQLEIVKSEIHALVHEDIPSIDASIRMRCGHVVRVFAVHPNPPRPGENTTKRDAELVIVGSMVRDNPTAIVLGDMNDVGWSRTSDLFREVSGLLDPRKGRGFFATFDATSWILRYPLDYVFHSDDFRVKSLEVLPSIGSDHFPLWMQLSHEPSAQPTQDSQELDAGDIDDAKEAIKNAEQLDQPKVDVKAEVIPG